MVLTQAPTVEDVTFSVTLQALFAGTVRPAAENVSVPATPVSTGVPEQVVASVGDAASTTFVFNVSENAVLVTADGVGLVRVTVRVETLA